MYEKLTPEELADWLIHENAKLDRRLFNAFCLAHPEITQVDQPVNWQQLRNVNDLYLQYLKSLDEMGRHPLDINENRDLKNEK